jgi:hypothetical protein
MKVLKTMIALFACAAILGCGGGGSSETQRLACLYVSASDGTGSYLDNGVMRQYDPAPVDMVNEAGPVQCVNRSVNGITLAALVNTGKLADMLKAEPAQRLVLGAGVNDALFGDNTLAEHLENLRRAVLLARASGAQPYIRGFNRFVVTETVTPQRLARRDEFNAGEKAEAQALGVPFFDLDAVEFNGLADLSPDQLHAGPAYNRRIANYIASQLH